MAEYTDADTKITTIEKFEKRIPVARSNFEKYDKDKKITLLEGDAADILAQLSDSYDFIFMDAAKGQYLTFLPDCKRLLKKGGLLVSDNVLQDGDVMESRFAVTRRNRTIHERMRDYLYAIKHDPELESVILNIGDGMALSYKL
jgi:predicted O-methyltransferase YrrM